MKVMVFDVPAEYGGALTILKQYYDKALNDKENEWYFVISTPSLMETKNVKVLKYSWVKKSWFHRLYFDMFVAHKLVKQYNADEVLSLQNVIIQGVKVKQTLYLHQALPFAEKRYHINENFKFWLYQNIIGRMIFKSIRRADGIIVQTNWIKDACVNKLKVGANKFKVIQPDLKIEVKSSYKQEDENNKLFFYPANCAPYKNHQVVIEAAKLLKQQQIENYKIVFTIKGNENSKINKSFVEVQENNLPIEFIGEVSLEEVNNYYSKSILLFPSYIESFGLAMLEARMHGSPILASDCEFSHEILKGYDGVQYFSPFNSSDLREKMRKAIKG